MTVRPGLWRPGIVIVWSVVVGMFVAFAIIWPSQAVAWLIALPLVGLVGWARLRAVRLEITESAVRARQGWYLPDKQAPRSKIRAIHFLPRLISFRGPDGESIMMIRPEYTLRQMVKVAGMLEVPLYDHTRFGMRTVTSGRLAYDPASRDPAS